jgi:hypothetical protein
VTVAYVFKSMAAWYAESTRELPKVKKTALGKAFKIEGRQHANPWRVHAEMLARENARHEQLALPPSERAAARVSTAQRYGLVPRQPFSETAAKKMAMRKIKA